VKIDFMDSESREMLSFYESALEEAASHRLMVNFHGANKPTGEARTWPNEMTREGVRGLEYNKWSALPPSHHAALPFTRYLAGHGDFTPCTLDPEKLGGTSFAQQLATTIVFTSPLQHWADRPERYLESEAVELIKRIPTSPRSRAATATIGSSAS
jgi:alpha-glucosidase